jgi:putative endonuclease
MTETNEFTWTVYLLRCSDNNIYTGCTSNIEDRLKRHYKGYINYTKTRLPIKVETSITFTNKSKAFDFEKYLKSGYGKAFSNKRLLSK